MDFDFELRLGAHCVSLAQPSLVFFGHSKYAIYFFTEVCLGAHFVSLAPPSLCYDKSKRDSQKSKQKIAYLLCKVVTVESTFYISLAQSWQRDSDKSSLTESTFFFSSCLGNDKSFRGYLPVLPLKFLQIRKTKSVIVRVLGYLVRNINYCPRSRELVESKL